jgi:glycosyltransferase involved in cell wall biosynthesis
MAKVSVITPVHNGATYLGAALDSVLEQAMGSWELIVVDDGSTDATPAVLSRYTDPRIVTVRQAHSGEAAARNTGLRYATGEYVGFLDADDLFLPNALADLTAFLDQHPEYEVVYSDGYVRDENDRRFTRLSEYRPGSYTGDVLEPMTLTSCIISLSCLLARRATIERNDIAFDRRLVIGPDWDFGIQLARHGRFGYVDALTCVYRVHQTNITRTAGRHRRNEDLILVRTKILNAEWFSELSVPTRRQLCYQLLIELLTGQPGRQHAIMESLQFRNLPVGEQSALMRHVAAAHLLRGAESEFAVQCLVAAQRLQPRDRKTNLLLRITQRRFGKLAIPGLLRVWQLCHRATHSLLTAGQYRPKRPPAALRSLGD